MMKMARERNIGYNPRMELLVRDGESALYALPKQPLLERYVSTSRETRRICNDPLVYGVDYTNSLRNACARTFTLFSRAHISMGAESNTLVLHILRGGLNFGIREALHEAYGWSKTTSAFISSQRVLANEGWQISENSYRKMPHVHDADVLFGDVVATGVSLRHALDKLIEEAHAHGASYRSLTFFTIGGDEAEKILLGASKKCAELFPAFQTARIIYIEGCFGVAQDNSPLSIRIPGTDLLRSPAILAPEFIESQNEALSYALERCTIYDAGSRAFDPHEYLEDVRDYWQKVLALGQKGMTVAEYLKERFPDDDRLSNSAFLADQSSKDSLQKVAEAQLARLH
jgi:hypothetical protein